MRKWPRWLPLAGLGAMIALILAGTYVYQTSGSLFGFGESNVERVALQGSDLPPSMKRCPVSGRSGTTPPYGATDAWTAVYAEACNVPPAHRYAFSWVLEYPSEMAAVAGYKAFIGSQDCTIAHGCLGGLGPNSNVYCGTAGCLGTWQRSSFVLTFQGAMGLDGAKKAVLNMDARASLSPALRRLR